MANVVRRLGSTAAARTPLAVRDRIRPLARRFGLAAPAGEWWASATPPWAPLPPDGAAVCNICRWTGAAFDGPAHCEHATCPQCGSIARDRFLLWCCFARSADPGGARVLETSPRLDHRYREMMRRWFDYRASDFDLSSHRADLQLDLQQIDLPDHSVDLVLTPHVLEHVPDPDQALAELHRIVAPGGRVNLQVPLVYGTTAPPVVPEFHADNTPVFFNFGWDLTDRLRRAGFEVDVLVTEEFRAMLAGESPAPPMGDDGFHLDEMVPHPRPSDLVAIAGRAVATRLGFEPCHQFVTWECRRP